MGAGVSSFLGLTAGGSGVSHSVDGGSSGSVAFAGTPQPIHLDQVEITGVKALSVATVSVEISHPAE
jgi:hypothetical protein